MDRRRHLIGGMAFWVVSIVIIYFLRKELLFDGPHDSLWIVLSFLTCILGAEFPDFDILIKEFLRHRHFTTHSILVPFLLTLPVFWVNDDTNFLLPVYGMFLIGNASHLLLDLFPSWKEKDGKIIDSDHAMAWFTTGLTGDDKYAKLTGTYLVNYSPFKFKNRETLPKNATRTWFVVNALLLIGYGVILMFLFQNWVL